MYLLKVNEKIYSWDEDDKEWQFHDFDKLMQLLQTNIVKSKISFLKGKWNEWGTERSKESQVGK